MNKRKRMAALKHRRHLKKLKERRRAQALAALATITPEPVAEVLPQAALAPRRRRKKAETVAGVAPPAESVPKKRGRKKKEASAKSETE